MSALPRVTCAIVGGSGLYDLAGLSDAEPVAVATPFGEPAAPPLVGRLAGQPVAFLARHGRDHRLLPSEINYRANVFALKLLGVERILSVSAVGSMTPRIRPRDLVLVDQFVDRTRRGECSFFGDGVAAHVSLADPVCPETRAVLRAAAGTGPGVHDGGTYLCIEGPAFSTRAESQLYRSWGVHVIGMTNLPEARLAREAEICYATLALVTDYDCWHEDEDAVSVGGLLDNLRAGNRRAAAILAAAVGRLPARGAGCRCGAALRDAVITPRERIPDATRARLRPILGKYLGDA